MAGVLVIGDIAAEGLAPASLEAAAAGAALASALNEPFNGALIGVNAAEMAAQFMGGFATLYVAEGAHYRPYTAQAYLDAAQALIAAASPSVVLLCHTPETREWVPRLAAQLDTGLVSDCVAITVEGKDLVVRKPVYGGGVVGEFVVQGSPRLVTLRAAAFEARAAAGATTTERVEVAPPAAGPIRLIEEVAAEAASGPKLKDAKIIVSGGRGLGGKDHWHYIEAVAEALGAAVGCSRPVADSGWVPSSHQVGLSGTCVTPELYIAVGISGAVQHLAGISAAKTVIAINNDPEADIFTRANYGVVGDCREVLPAFAARVKQLRS